MAIYTDEKAIHATLSGTSSDLVRFSQPWGGVEVVNRVGSSPLAVLVPPTSSTALPLDAGTEVVMPGESKKFYPGYRNGDNPTLPHSFRVSGNGNEYSVIGIA